MPPLQRKVSWNWALLGIVTLGLAFPHSGHAQSSDQFQVADHARDTLLRKLYLLRSDFGFRDDYMPPDSFALNKFLDLNHRPLELYRYADTWKRSAEKGLDAIIERMQFDVQAEHAVKNARVAAVSPTLLSGVNLYYRDNELNRLLSLIYEIVASTIPATTDSMLKTLSDEERAFLRTELVELLREEELAEERDVYTHDSIQIQERAHTERFAAFGTKTRPEFLINSGLSSIARIVSATDALVEYLGTNNLTIEKFLGSDVEIPSHSQTPYLGLHAGWKVSGTEDDHHVGDFTVLIDFGGNDTYDLTYDPSRPHPVIIIDLDGNDQYRGSDFTLGAGVFSLGLLYDRTGDDTYTGGSFGIGCGWFGVGALIDNEGDDSYNGDTFVQGSAGFGCGLLYDKAGRDVYSAAFCSQAFGFTGGIGALVDVTGNDSYIAGGKYSDVLRYDDHYLSLSQGFGYGLRPHLSGGIGALVDLAGADHYTADIFGQGCSYWRSIGLIADAAGSDHYTAHQYAQGSATHMTLGALVDYDGDDFYLSKGVSQGCGHDYSYGALLDLKGNDVYHATDLSQAAGSANGVGELIDMQGADRYFITNHANTHGYGNPRREFGSLGIMLDLGGVDVYQGYGADDIIWRAAGLWGGGMDCEWSK